VEATVSLQDNRGVPLKGEFSVAVTDDGTGMTDVGHSILATLLLCSELRGTIETPAFYLQEDSLARAALVLLLWVQGWGRYGQAAVPKGHALPRPVNPEQFMQIPGQVKSVSIFAWGSDYAVRIRGVTNSYKNDVRTDS